MKTIDVRHQELLYPCVRVRTPKAGGSGTVIYSSKVPKSDDYETYLLTNHHVVENCIRIEKKWNALLQREVKSDVRSTVDTEFFRYKWQSRNVGATQIQADVVAYDKDQDIALLKLRDTTPQPYIAKLYPRDAENKLFIFTPVFAVGAALGHPPVVTSGHISGFGDEIDNYEFWLSTAPTIFGNSGGAIFLQETSEFIGIPSRISVVMIGFGGDAITHLSYFIPITRIYKFLEEQIFQFIYDPAFTSLQCEKLREKKREEEEQRLVSRDHKGEDED